MRFAILNIIENLNHLSFNLVYLQFEIRQTVRSGITILCSSVVGMISGRVVLLKSLEVATNTLEKLN